MKNNFAICCLIVLGLATRADAAFLIDQDWTVNTAIPEGNPVGITEYQTLSGLSATPIADVSVDLDITGGYNGGLYGYLTLQDANGNTVTEVLLNEVGTSPSNPLGSSGSGFNVTLSDAGTINGSIHNATGDPTGIWQPDSANTLDGTFGGLTANGTWTLFLADEFSGGGTSTLQDWGLVVTPVPEASEIGKVYGLCCFLALVCVVIIQRKGWSLKKLARLS
jgi:hypothetical protein